MSVPVEKFQKLLSSIELDSLAEIVKNKELIQEYCKLFKKEVNNNKVIEREAEDWEGDFLFIIGRDKYLDEDIITYCDLWHGKCREMVPLASREERKTAYIFEGPFENWYKLWIGEIGPIRGITKKMFKLEGSLAKVAKYKKSTITLLNCSIICFAKIGKRLGLV